MNLGVSEQPRLFSQRNLLFSNSLDAVRKCQDKRLTLQALKVAEVGAIEWTISETIARDWLAADRKIVVRSTATGHSGIGLTIHREGPIPIAPLYTRYFRKHAEYRVHVAFGNVILIQQKRKRNHVEQDDVQSLVRTHANGWIFATNNLSCDDRNYRTQLGALALRAANAIGAGHCAVDILVNHERNNNMVVCEINSCPAMEAGSTLEAYATVFATEIRRHSS